MEYNVKLFSFKFTERSKVSTAELLLQVIPGRRRKNQAFFPSSVCASVVKNRIE